MRPDGKLGNSIGILLEVSETVFLCTTVTHVPYASSGPIEMHRACLD